MVRKKANFFKKLFKKKKKIRDYDSSMTKELRPKATLSESQSKSGYTSNGSGYRKKPKNVFSLLKYNLKKRKTKNKHKKKIAKNKAHRKTSNTVLAYRAKKKRNLLFAKKNRRKQYKPNKKWSLNKFTRFFKKKKKGSKNYHKNRDNEATFLRELADIVVTDKLKDQNPYLLAEKKRKEYKLKTKAKAQKKANSKRNYKSQNIGARGRLFRRWNKLMYSLYLVDTLYDPWLKSDFTNEESSRKDGKIRSISAWLPYIINSTILYIIAYIVVYLLYQFSVIFVAAGYNIDSVLFYYEVMFPIGNFSNLWTSWNIIAITLAGPIFSVLVGVFLYFYFIKAKKIKTQLLKLFFTWIVFHSFNMFFGAWVAGIITDQGFGYVANWLYMSTAAKFFIAMVALFTLAIIGWNSTKQFLETSNSISRVRKINRNFFLLYQGIVPWFLGTALLLWIKIPNAPPQHSNIIVYDSILLFSILFAILPMFFRPRVKPQIFVDPRKRRKTQMNYIYMSIAVLSIFIYRFGLSNGLHFVIKWTFEVSPW